MSEYAPITGELRLMLADINWTEIVDHMQTNSGAVVDGDWLDHWHECVEQTCDSIDSIHAALEAENERLREQANRPTQDVDEWQSIVCSAIDVSVAVAQMALAGERP